LRRHIALNGDELKPTACGLHLPIDGACRLQVEANEQESNTDYGAETFECCPGESFHIGNMFRSTSLRLMKWYCSAAATSVMYLSGAIKAGSEMRNGTRAAKRSQAVVPHDDALLGFHMGEVLHLRTRLSSCLGVG